MNYFSERLLGLFVEGYILLRRIRFVERGKIMGNTALGEKGRTHTTMT
jgi:hypothetical protein